jgi:hypothetical protein
MKKNHIQIEIIMLKLSGQILNNIIVKIILFEIVFKGEAEDGTVNEGFLSLFI